VHTAILGHASLLPYSAFKLLRICWANNSLISVCLGTASMTFSEFIKTVYNEIDFGEKLTVYE